MYREDVELIRKYYKVDYERFGYELPNPKDYPIDSMAMFRTPVAELAARGVVYKQHRHWLR